MTTRRSGIILASEHMVALKRTESPGIQEYIDAALTVGQALDVDTSGLSAILDNSELNNCYDEAYEKGDLANADKIMEEIDYASWLAIAGIFQSAIDSICSAAQELDNAQHADPEFSNALHLKPYQDALLEAQVASGDWAKYLQRD